VGLFVTRFSFLLLFTIFPLFVKGESSSSNTPNRILYLMQAGHGAEALTLYKEYKAQLGHHDVELIHQLALSLLDQGYRSNDPETLLLTIFGAGISINDKAQYILEEGLRSPHPQLQLISLNFLSQYQNDRADEALNWALSSNNLLIRLEGAHHLCQKKGN